MTDSIELRQVFDLYGLKLQPTTDDENDASATNSASNVFTEASKAYYSYVLDRAWAQDILQTELHFWDMLGLMLEHGHKLKSSFWQTNPLQSKKVDSCSKELEVLEQNLRGFA